MAATVRHSAAANATVKILEANLQAYIEIQNAYEQCHPDIQAVVADMLALIRDDEATDDEKKRAMSTVLDALFPSLAADVWECERQTAELPESQALERQMDQQEATFAERLRDLMESKGMTQEVLAERIGVSQPAISNMLNRKSRPQQRTISRIAQALGVDPQSLWPV